MNKVKLFLLINLLNKSLKDKNNLYQHMMEFEDIVGENEVVEATEQQQFQIEELASFIPYFSNSSIHLAEDPALFDDNKMFKMVKDTLNKVKKIR